MRKEKLNRLLDSIYELEGLVHLAITRDDSPAMLPELIRRKSRELMDHAETATMAEVITIVETAHIQPASELEEQYIEEDYPEPPFEPAPEPEVVVAETPAPVTPTPGISAPKAQAAPAVRPQKTERLSEPRGRLVFSINDRYRFRKELFNKSDTEFNNTMALVASMEGYDEAEDYFLNELQWDAESPEVIDFLEILKNYFK